MSSFFATLFGALIGGTTALIVQITKARLDNVNYRGKQLSEIITELANQASEYWLQPYQMSAENSDAKIIECRVAEARIYGLQTRLGPVYEAFIQDIPPERRGEIKAAMPNFIDAISGGTFKNRDGSVDLDRGDRIQVVSNQLIASIDNAIHERYSLTFLLWKCLFR